MEQAVLLQYSGSAFVKEKGTAAFKCRAFFLLEIGEGGLQLQSFYGKRFVCLKKTCQWLECFGVVLRDINAMACLGTKNRHLVMLAVV